jgi:hypothetical protein
LTKPLGGRDANATICAKHAAGLQVIRVGFVCEETQMAVPRTIVLPEQFEIDDAGITHKPTGWKFAAYPGDIASGHIIKGRLGDKLETGEDFQPDAVEEMAWRLWLRYLKAKRKI